MIGRRISISALLTAVFAINFARALMIYSWLFGPILIVWALSLILLMATLFVGFAFAAHHERSR